MSLSSRARFDVLVRGGTVVTSERASRADVGVVGGRIAAIGEGGEPTDGELPGDAGETIDASGLFVLPGVVDVHTHTRLASEAEPDRFFQDSVAAAFGGTTTFLVFNTPASGAPLASARSLVRDLETWKAASSGDSAVDYGLSLVVTGQHDDPVGELPAVIEAGVPTCKAFMVYDFRLDDRTLFRSVAEAGRRGGMIEVHCEDPVLIDAAVAAELSAGHRAPRFHAVSRPSFAEAVATHRAMAFARLADAPVHVVHLSSADALAEVRSARATGVRAFAETCPHYLTLTSDRYDDPSDATAARYVMSPPLRSAADRDALWAGLADGTLDLVATDHVPDRIAVEKQTYRESFDRISNGAPGIETLLSLVYSEGVAAGRISLERMVDLLSTTPARLFGMPQKGAIEVGRDADLVLFDPSPTRLLRQADLHHTSDYTPYEGIEVAGAVRTVILRGHAIVRDGRFVGQRGFGAFLERGPVAFA